ncbi:uncharacterized protein NECHADRAFT_89399 [Fusarium vanettenii 77-13-4]|uniref:2EXR domain-containing protein n=1 Tax=Fusarium vanettenii (strain ATCC MYA-4622 / CBS 123669 / FGSC 9596 / NRRL 45880 / 77-13-4) TaxID=660122 RepID=C7ZR36_FUSV7|nr:uncharacterized protein NECHADRAFT_89399 [Fusarium vanettenii 77-13-4]EEU33523.1 predicted protein [Fusarium vanettenii 77-13-4]
MARSTRSYTRQLARDGLEIPATTFRLNRLCLEVRQAIWEFTLPYRQVHYVNVKSCNDGTRDYLQIELPPLPVAFHVNSESRFTARRCLERFDRHTRPMTDGSPRPYGYFNPRTNFLHIPELEFSDDTGDLLPSLPRVNFPNLSICGHESNLVENTVYQDPGGEKEYWITEAISSRPLPSQVFIAEMAIIGGFRAHARCQKYIPVGDPTATDRPYRYGDRVWSLLQHAPNLPDRGYWDGIFPIRHLIMPLACDCPGVAGEARKKVEKKAREATGRRT